MALDVGNNKINARSKDNAGNYSPVASANPARREPTLFRDPVALDAWLNALAGDVRVHVLPKRLAGDRGRHLVLGSLEVARPGGRSLAARDQRTDHTDRHNSLESHRVSSLFVCLTVHPSQRIACPSSLARDGVVPTH